MFGSNFFGALSGEAAELRDLDTKLNTMLPTEYRECYDDVQPVSMGTAGLKYDEAGRVAWDEIWGSFCDLAMAGGPPHKGTLLEPATAEQIHAQPERYRTVVEEISRGIRMVADVAVAPSENPGWVRVMPPLAGMAGWLVRAINMENVSACLDGDGAVDLPAGPEYRLEKEIKNVITVVAKTCHYFADHTASGQQKKIARLLASAEAESPLLQPATHGRGIDAARAQALSELIAAKLPGAAAGGGADAYRGWFGCQCEDVRSAIWMMRALVVNNVLARREETVLYVPVDPRRDPTGDLVVSAVSKVKRLAAARAVSR